MKSFKSWLNPPPATDPEQALRATIVHWVAVSAIVVVAVLTVLIPAVESDSRYTLPLYLTSLVGAIAIYVVLHLGWIRTAGALFSVLGLLLTLWASFASGGVKSPQLSMGVLVIMLTGFVWSSRAAIWMAFCTSASLLGIELAREMGLAPEPFIEATTFTTWAALTSVLALSAAFLHVFVRAVHNARDEAAEQSRRLEEEMRQREEAEASLHRAEKLEALGRLTGGIAHDFNNILTVLLADSTTLERHATSGRPLTEVELDQIREIRTSTERAAELTRQLLSFARQRVGTPEIVDPDEAIEALEPMLRRVIREDIHLRISLGARGAAVRIDAGQLEQVIMNLILNARDAMPGGGDLTLSTETVELDEVWAEAHAHAQTGSQVVLQVEDTGVGIKMEDLDRIFDPFFTSKELSSGTGLGLSSVDGIVTRAGGHIVVESVVDKGSTFRIYLPAVAERPSKTPSHDTHRMVDGPRETILLCEDNDAVLRVTRRILESAGYEVLAASAPSRALELVRDHGGQIDLLVSDLIMPGMNGRELAKQVAAARPGIGILIVSGYIPDDVQASSAEPNLEVLEKPFTPEVLLGRLATILGRNGKA